MTPPDTLIAALRQHNGHASSTELQAQLGLSQPTVSRLLAPLVASGQVVKVGAARSQRYLLPRLIVAADPPGVAQRRTATLWHALPTGRGWLLDGRG